MNRRKTLKALGLGLVALLIPKVVLSKPHKPVLSKPRKSKTLGPNDKSMIEHCYINGEDLDTAMFEQTSMGKNDMGGGDMIVRMKDRAIISLKEYNELLGIAGRKKAIW